MTLIPRATLAAIAAAFMAVALLSGQIISMDAARAQTAAPAHHTPQARAIYEAVGKGNIAAVMEAATDDIVWAMNGRREDCPCLGQYKGKADVAAFLRSIPQVWTFTEFSARDFIAVPGKVVVLGRFSMKHNKTGKPFSSDFVHVFTFDGGKLKAFQEFADSASMAAAYRP